MAWVSGVFSRLHNWVNDRDANIKILATRHDAEDDNLAAGINNTLTKDGQNSATANLPMGNFRHTGVGNASARTDYASAAQIQDSEVVYVADTGTADVYAIALSPAITAYVTGNLFWFKAANTNTGASTINVNSVGAKSIVRTVNAVLVAGDIQANGIYGVIYDGTNFQLTSPITANLEFSAENAALVTVLIGNTDVVTLNLGTVSVGNRIIFNWKMGMLKGGTGGLTTMLLLKDSGTAVVEFYHNSINVREDRNQFASQQWTIVGSAVAKITTGGTLTIIVRMSSAGSNGTINAGDGELYSMILNTGL